MRDVSQSLHLRSQLKNSRPPFCITILRYSECVTQTDGFASVWEIRSNYYPPGKVTGDYFGIYEHFMSRRFHSRRKMTRKCSSKRIHLYKNGDPPPVYGDFRWIKWPESSYKKSWDTSNPNACVRLSKSFFPSNNTTARMREKSHILVRRLKFLVSVTHPSVKLHSLLYQRAFAAN